jgi:hypothetical protein
MIDSTVHGSRVAQYDTHVTRVPAASVINEHRVSIRVSSGGTAVRSSTVQ